MNFAQFPTEPARTHQDIDIKLYETLLKYDTSKLKEFIGIVEAI